MATLKEEKAEARLARLTREMLQVPAFGILEQARRSQYDWHQHPYHQLLYAIHGSVHVEVGKARYFLPPSCAAWIAAGTVHRTTLVNTELATVWFRPTLVRWPTAARQMPTVRIIAAPPLLREMVKHAAEYPSKIRGKDLLRKSYFRTLALLCESWITAEMPFRLPSSSDPQLARGIEYTLMHLQSARLSGASRAAAMSERTFRRSFSEHLAMTWREYLLRARLLSAMDLLIRPSSRIADAADQVGFNSPSAFTKAFVRFAGMTPSEYQLLR
jgi:AraC-like DNA-binding protein